MYHANLTVAFNTCIKLQPFYAHCYMCTAINRPVPDRIMPSFVIFDTERKSARMSKMRLNPVWHRTVYSCTHMATVGAKGLMKQRHGVC